MDTISRLFLSSFVVVPLRYYVTTHCILLSWLFAAERSEGSESSRGRVRCLYLWERVELDRTQRFLSHLVEFGVCRTEWRSLGSGYELGSVTDNNKTYRVFQLAVF